VLRAGEDQKKFPKIEGRFTFGSNFWRNMNQLQQQGSPCHNSRTSVDVGWSKILLFFGKQETHQEREKEKNERDAPHKKKVFGRRIGMENYLGKKSRPTICSKTELFPDD
jgi:hypothetical protein